MTANEAQVAAQRKRERVRLSEQQRQLNNIRGFTEAAVAVGRHYVERERQMFEFDNHSCYSEGWAAGYLEAMKIVERFVKDTVGGATP